MFEITPEEAIKILDEKTMIIPARCGGKSYTLNAARKTAIEALEKQVPKKPKTKENGVRYCPKCGKRLNFADIVTGANFCDACGQCILWERGGGQVKCDEIQKRCITEDCPYQTGDPCTAAESCGGYEGAE